MVVELSLVDLNDWHPNDLGFSQVDMSTYKSVSKVIKSFAGVFMYDGRGNHMYGPRSPGFFIGTRVHGCGGASAGSWSCRSPGDTWKR
jgi:hypothetical protein